MEGWNQTLQATKPVRPTFHSFTHMQPRTLILCSRLLLSALLILLSNQFRAQNSTVAKRDSLIQLINSGPDDTLKAVRMYQLSVQYDYFNSTERVTWSVASFNLSKELNYVNGMTTVAPRLINILFHREMNDLALRYCYEYLGWLTERNDTIGLQQNYNLYANLLGRMDKYREADVYYKKALDYNTRSGNQKQCAYILSNLSILMRKMNKPDSALYYADAAIAILRKRERPFCIVKCDTG